jgi:uncharacterized protein (DUF2141 family)
MKFILSFILISNFAFASDLVIEISGIRSNKGKVYFQVDNEKSYKTKTDKDAYFFGGVKAKKGSLKISVSVDPKLKYAISIFHDENDNEKMDMGMFDIPKEGVGISGLNKNSSDAKFKDVAVNAKKTQKISLNYY